MAEQNCKYFSEFKNNDKHIYCTLGKLYCDLLSCKNSVGEKQQYEAEGPWVGKCKIGELLLEPRKSKLIGKLIGAVVNSKEEGHSVTAT